MRAPRTKKASAAHDRAPDQEARDAIRDDLGTTLLVEASAGTGKTTCLVARMLSLVASGVCAVGEIAAVTFTRKAAAELRSRFQASLERAGESDGPEKERVRRASVQAASAFVGTVHAFCARLLRERPIEAGVDPGFEVLDPDVDRALRAEAWRECLEDLTASGSTLIAELDNFGLSGRDLGAAFHDFAEHRDAEWPCPRTELGGTTAAAAELAKYAEHMASLLRSFPEVRGTDELMSAYERVARKVRQSRLDVPAELHDILEDFKKRKIAQCYWPSEGKLTSQQVAKRELARWDEFRGAHAEPLVRRWREARYAVVLRVFCEALAVYDRRRQALGALNHQDLLGKAAALLREHPEARRYFQRRFRRLLVDEFQDTDPVQAEVMLLLADSDTGEVDWRRCRPAAGSLFVVGDPKQSIYRFRRADIVTYNRVKDIIVESGGKVLSLTASFRTVPSVLEWLQGVSDALFPSSASEHQAASARLLPGRAADAGESLAGVVRLELDAELKVNEELIAADARRIASEIRAALDRGDTVPRTPREEAEGVKPSVKPGDFLIVSYGKNSLARYARELEALGIPSEITGGGLAGADAELRLLEAAVDAATEPDDPLAVVAFLRGECSGLSDAELYAYRAAGGRFHAGAAPLAKDEAYAGVIAALARLRRYGAWLGRYLPVTALERIASDLGLFARATAGPRGNLQAGTLARALEALRTAPTAWHSMQEVLDHLRSFFDPKAEIEGIVARPPEEPGVRILNLHKAKGLEAPVVFLANPTGHQAHKPDLHVDRSGDATRAYFVVRKKLPESAAYRPAVVLAQPPGWDEHEQTEGDFQDAETNRLLYVAVTRAAARLVVSQRPSKKNFSLWHGISEALGSCPELEDSGPQAPPARPKLRVELEAVAAALEALNERRAELARPTRNVMNARALGLARVSEPALDTIGGAEVVAGLDEAPGFDAALGFDEAPGGAGWGSVIHALLEVEMRTPGADLLGIARGALEEEELDPQLAPLAVEAARSVAQSDIWKRALATSRRLIEVPFERRLSEAESAMLDGASAAAAGRARPTLLRGVIDLVFEEPAGWVIVDYKTDAATRPLEELAARYRGQIEVYRKSWEAMTGTKVHEAGLLFTRSGSYVTVKSS